VGDARKPARRGGGSSATREPPRGKPFEKGNPYAWKPGQSGNPSGVPKDRAAAAAYIERRLREEFLDHAINALKVYAMKGSAPHMIEALNRMAGRATEAAAAGVNAEVTVNVRHSQFEEQIRRIAGLSPPGWADDEGASEP
jgi:hypothetical protein